MEDDMVQTTLEQDRKWLYDELDTASKLGVLKLYKEIPSFVEENLKPKFKLRHYQIEAFSRFFYYFNDYPDREHPIHLLYNMATGSGKRPYRCGLCKYN